MGAVPGVEETPVNRLPNILLIGAPATRSAKAAKSPGQSR